MDLINKRSFVVKLNCILLISYPVTGNIFLNPIIFGRLDLTMLMDLRLLSYKESLSCLNCDSGSWDSTVIKQVHSDGDQYYASSVKIICYFATQFLFFHLRFLRSFLAHTLQFTIFPCCLCPIYSLSPFQIPSKIFSQSYQGVQSYPHRANGHLSTCRSIRVHQPTYMLQNQLSCRQCIPLNIFYHRAICIHLFRAFCYSSTLHRTPSASHRW